MRGSDGEEMEKRMLPSASRKFNPAHHLQHPGAAVPTFLAVLFAAICLIVFAIVVYLVVTFYRGRRSTASTPVETSGTESSSPVFPFESTISQSTPDLLDNQEECGRDSPSSSFGGCRSKTAISKQQTLPVMTQRHQSFRRQLSQQLDRHDSSDTGSSRACYPAGPSETSSCPTQPLLPKNTGQQPPNYSGCDRTEEGRPRDPDSPDGNVSGSSRFWFGTGGVGRLYLTLKYQSESSRLHVHLLRAEALPANDFSGTCDPYVKLYLLPDRKARHQTKLHRKTLNPVFDETFEFDVSAGPGSTTSWLGDRVLQLSVYDFDRFSRHDLVGVATVICSADLLSSAAADEGRSYELDLENLEEIGDMGELLISLTYLPMAGRLTMDIIKGRRMKPVSQLGMSSTCVKVTLTCHGKHIKKKKTSVKRSTSNPIYNESMVFDVPRDSVENVSFIIRVISQDQYDNSEMIGACALGREYVGIGHDHWMEMLETPRKPVAQWHGLVEKVEIHPLTEQ